MVSYLFLLLLVAYDLWSTRKVHRATLWAGAFMVFVYTIRIPIGKTEAWHAFADGCRRWRGSVRHQVLGLRLGCLSPRLCYYSSVCTVAGSSSTKEQPLYW
jgi:hypothetical protein